MIRMQEDARFETSRRQLLLGSAALGTVGLAGCADEDPGDDDHDDHDHDDDHDHGGSLDIGVFELYERGADPAEDDWVVEYHAGHWHGSLVIEAGHEAAFDPYVEDEDGNEIPLGEDEEYQINAVFDEEAGAEEILELHPHGDHLDVSGTETGTTFIILQMFHDDHSDWDSPTLEVEVVEDADEHDGHDDHDHDDDHDDGHDDHDHDDGHDDHDHDDGHDDHDHDDDHDDY